MKKNKIIEYGYEEEVNIMLEDGMTYKDIRNEINSRYPDKMISIMCVQRYNTKQDENKYKEMIEKDINPIDELTREFRKAVTKNTREVRIIIDECKSILEDAKKNGSSADRTRAALATFKGLEQIVRNWQSLQQYGFRQVTNIENVNIKIENEVKALILNFTDKLIEIKNKLCDECKKKLEYEKLLEDLIKK